MSDQKSSTTAPRSSFTIALSTACVLAPLAACHDPGPDQALGPAALASKPTPQSTGACALLDNPILRAQMSAMFERSLLVRCGRTGEIGGKPAAAPDDGA